jgi:Protein of unknown function (DUF4231)
MGDSAPAEPGPDDEMVTVMNAFETLLGSLDADICRFDRESKKHKALHRRCQTGVIALTALTTIVAGAGLILPESSGRAVQFAVLCLTAVTAAVTAWAEMRRARELWQHEREVYYALLDIQREMKFFAATGEPTEHDVKEYFEKITLVLTSSTRNWGRIVEQAATERRPPPGAAPTDEP